MFYQLHREQQTFIGSSIGLFMAASIWDKPGGK